MNFRIPEAEPIRISSGQIVATSHDLTRNGGLVRDFPLFQGNLGWWNIMIWPDFMEYHKGFEHFEHCSSDEFAAICVMSGIYVRMIPFLP